ncbi:hypothetical protein [Halovivax cerinus]|uniref:Uncharacterized protein n=1 Tax=Halovivax cerinus TaxID=1487865 RepID=A0ABD5NJ29_9EURY|nr:hypothetical protein [Halovivax cerinus]
MSATAGMSGFATATSTPDFTAEEAKQATRKYEDVEVLRDTIAAETELLRTVAAEGYIESATVDALGIESLGEPETDGGATVTVDPHSIEDGVTADLLVSWEVPEGTFIISVKPELDSAFAVIDTHGSEEIVDLYKKNTCPGRECDDNEECEYQCIMCTKGTCPGCGGDDRKKLTWHCECVEDCGWW